MKGIISISATIAILCTCGSAYAQGAETATKTDDIETLLVTATRRTTRLFETPVAVTSVSQDALIERNITNALTIEKLVPSLKVQDQRTLGMGAVQLTLRGVGNSNFTEQGDPNVGFHVDGIYLSRPQAAIAFMYDLERVEVLRGPQGTLFGRNSTVGTINLVTAKPSADALTGSIDTQFGRFNDRMLRGFINIPIFQDHSWFNDMAVRVAAFSRRRDSYYSLRKDTVLDPLLQNFAGENGDPSNPYLSAFGDPTDETRGAGAINEMGVRASVRWNPLDRITLDGTYELFQNNSPAAPLTVRDAPYEAFLDMPMTLDQRTEGFRAKASYQQPNVFSLEYSFGLTKYEHTSTVDLDAGVHRYRTSSYGGAEEAQFFYDAPFGNDSRTHEVQVRSEWDFPVQALAGYFNFEEDTNRNLWIDIPQAAGGVILFNQPSRVASSEAFYGEVSWNITPKWELRGGLRYSMDRKTDTNGSRSDTFPGVGLVPFGCPLLAEEAGLTPEQARESNFCNISSTESQFRDPFPEFDRVFFNDESFENLDWAVTLSYTPADDSVVYAKAASGYKSGGFQDTFYLPRTNESFFPVLDPENLISYEVGAKSTFFGGSLRVSADVYLMDYSNKQESILVDFGDLFCPFTFGDFDRDGFIDEFLRDGLAGSPGVFELLRFDPETFALNASPEELAMCNEPNFDRQEFGINRVELVPLNISDAVTAGAEVEWFWQITPNDRLFGFLALNFFNRIGDVDTSALPLVLTDSLACNDRVGGCPDVGTLDGNRLPYSPVISLAVNYGHDFWIGDSILSFNAALNVSSSYFLSIWNVDCYESIASGEQVCNNGDKQNAYATLDVNVRYTSPLQNWFAEAYGTNITDTTYATFNRRNSADGVTGYAFNPRAQFGGRLGYRF